MDGIVAVTYRCNCKCVMCDTWKHPSPVGEEIGAAELEKLPQLVRLNLTGGEPFLRADLDQILEVVKRKAQRVVISSNGLMTSRILDVMSRHPEVGIRISFDGLGATHDVIRGVPGIHDRALATLHGLKQLGVRDLGIAVTISDRNSPELTALYDFARSAGVELASSILHNAYYFHKMDNEIKDRGAVEDGIWGLIRAYLRSSSPKDWFRAYFTRGIIDQMHGRERPLKCTMASDSFYVDPYGYMRPCNVMDFPFGNLKLESFDAIWNGPRALEARARVAKCQASCWMIGSVGHLIRHKPWAPFAWILHNKWLKGREGA